MEMRLEVLDARGTSLFWQFNQRPGESTRGRSRIVIHDRNFQRDPSGRPDPPETYRLRLWDITAAATDLPFEFRDVPTP